MWYIEMGGMYKINNEKHFGRKIYIEASSKEIRNIATTKFNNEDVYATIFQYNNEDQNNSDLFGPLYIDLDMNFNNDNEYKKLKEDLTRIVTYLNLQYNIPKEYIRFFFTGKKGFHLIIPAKVFGVKPRKDLNFIYKEIAKELNDNTIYKIVDTKIYDKKRLLRVVNTINGKTGLYKVPIAYDDIIKFSYEDIKEYASSPKTISISEVDTVEKARIKFNSITDNINKINEKKAKSILVPKNVDLSKIIFPKCIQEIYKNGAVDGSRNNTTIILASAFFQKGIDYETTLALINKWNLEKNSPSLSDHEIKTTIDSAYQQIQSGRRYGCSSIKDVGLCVGKECKICR